MIRTLGVTELLSSLPGVVVVVFALVTQLGDFWFTFTACALAYLLGSHVPRLGDGLTRERAATVLALLALAVALTVSLKTAFGLPRPPGAGVADHAELVPLAVRDVYVSMATGHGFGFPSGHATVTAIVWGGFAWALRVGTRRQRVGVAAGVTLLVGLSRLVLGVHYLADVLAGFAVAAVALSVALVWLRTPARVFALAAVVALGGLAVGGFTRDTGAALAMGATGAVVWQSLDGRIPEPTTSEVTVTGVLGLSVVGSLLLLAFVAGASDLAVTVMAGVGVGLLLVLPLVGERVSKRRATKTADSELL